MVSCNEVAKIEQHASILYVLWRYRILPHTVKVGGATNVRGIGIPRKHIACLLAKRLPPFISVEQARCGSVKHFPSTALLEKAGNFFFVGPNIFEIDVVVFLISAKRFGFKIKIDRTRKRISNNQRRCA